MKNRISNYFFLSVLWISVFSCQKDLLNTIPNDRLSENIFWKTEQDAQVAVNSLYNDLDGTNIFAFDAFTDIMHVNQPFNVNAYIELGTYDATSSVILNEWSRSYTGIAADNYFLANVDKIPSVPDTALLSRFKAEARFLRAYQYIKLTSLFGEVPLLTQPISVADARQVKKSTLTELYDFIDQELTAILPSLPLSYAADNTGRITRGAALALKARADLYSGRYAASAAAAQAVMDTKVYQLYPVYANLFSYGAENNQEVILDKQFIGSSNSNNVFQLLAPYSQKSSQSTFVPTKALVDQYETIKGQDITEAGSGYDPDNPYAARDPRLKASIFLEGDVLPSGAVFHPAPNSGTADAVGNTYIASTTGFNVKKYVNTQDYADPTNCGINILLLRYAEVLLTYAEAKIELNELDQSVYTAINQVRNGRTDVQLPSLKAGLSQAALRTAVRHERTIELAFEGLHLADIRRWKTAATVVPGNVYGITYKQNGVSKTVQVAVSRLFDAKKHYIWPIPQTEIDQNHYLTQNAGW